MKKLSDPSDLTDLPLLSKSELGGGCLANTPLSMHSERMAIQSALSLSSNASSCGSICSSMLMRQARLFKLPGKDK